MPVLFATAHQPTQAQIDDLDYIDVHLKDHDPELFEQLIQCPSDVGELYSLAHKLLTHATDFGRVVLPIGSPAFMACFMTKYATLKASYPDEEATEQMLGLPPLPELLFSHSVRDSVEVDGVKRSVFNHQHFIKL